MYCYLSNFSICTLNNLCTLIIHFAVVLENSPHVQCFSTMTFDITNELIILNIMCRFKAVTLFKCTGLCFLTVTLRASLVEQEMHTLSEHMSSARFLVAFMLFDLSFLCSALYIIVCRLFFFCVCPSLIYGCCLHL